jgi:hypothetical protein
VSVQHSVRGAGGGGGGAGGGGDEAAVDLATEISPPPRRCLPSISPISRPYLAQVDLATEVAALARAGRRASELDAVISPASPLHLPYISLHLPYISPTYPYTSPIPRLHLA